MASFHTWKRSRVASGESFVFGSKAITSAAMHEAMVRSSAGRGASMASATLSASAPGSTAGGFHGTSG